MLNFNKTALLFVAVIIFTFISRVARLDYPSTYYFDEVYHAFTAQAYASNDPRGYEWWNGAPEGFAYEWLHPPIAKLIQAASIKVFGDTPFFWRFPGVLAAVGIGMVLFLVGRDVFQSKTIGLFASALWALDGLSFTMSRITMNDIYFTFWAVLAFYFLCTRRSIFLVGLFTGLAVSTKWTGAFLIVLIGAIWVFREIVILRSNIAKKAITGAFALTIVPVAVYIASYFQFFLQGHTIEQFMHLHQQTWWYQTGLSATHPYSSPTWQWPIMWRPLYAFVERTNSSIANIYFLGNPFLFWGGLVGLLALLIFFLQGKIKKREQGSILITVVFYFGMFFPWLISPRIMFFYHYLPALPFLFLTTAFVLQKLWIKNQLFVVGYLTLAALAFVFFYPHWSALPVPVWWDKLYYWLPSWR